MGAAGETRYGDTIKAALIHPCISCARDCRARAKRPRTASSAGAAKSWRRLWRVSRPSGVPIGSPRPRSSRPRQEDGGKGVGWGGGGGHEIPLLPGRPPAGGRNLRALPPPFGSAATPLAPADVRDAAGAAGPALARAPARPRARDRQAARRHRPAAAHGGGAVLPGRPHRGEWGGRRGWLGFVREEWWLRSLREEEEAGAQCVWTPLPCAGCICRCGSRYWRGARLRPPPPRQLRSPRGCQGLRRVGAGLLAASAARGGAP